MVRGGASGRSLETRDAGRRRNGLLHGEVDAFVKGNVDWVSSRPVLILEDGTEIPTRSIAIFSMEDGEWKMVQGHKSVGVSNEELFGE